MKSIFLRSLANTLIFSGLILISSPGALADGRETGNGGHPLAIEFAKVARDTIAHVRESYQLYPPQVDAIKLDQVLSQATFVVVDHELQQDIGGVQQKTPLASDVSSGTVHIYDRGFQDMLRGDRTTLEALVLHELAILLRVDTTGSYRLMNAYLVDADRRSNGGTATVIRTNDFKIVSTNEQFTALLNDGGSITLKRRECGVERGCVDFEKAFASAVENFVAGGNTLDERSRISITLDAVLPGLKEHPLDFRFLEYVQWMSVKADLRRQYLAQIFSNWKNTHVFNSDFALGKPWRITDEAKHEPTFGTLENARIQDLKSDSVMISGKNLELVNITGINLGNPKNDKLPELRVTGTDIVMRDVRSSRNVLVDGAGIRMSGVFSKYKQTYDLCLQNELEVSGEKIEIANVMSSCLSIKGARNFELRDADFFAVAKLDKVSGWVKKLSVNKPFALKGTLGIENTKIKVSLEKEASDACFPANVTFPENALVSNLDLTILRRNADLDSCTLGTSNPKARFKNFILAPQALGRIQNQSLVIDSMECTSFQYLKDFFGACFKQNINL